MNNISKYIEQKDSSTQSPSLQGYLHYETKGDKVYARHCVSSYIKNGKVYHDEVYLGQVIDRQLGLFKSRDRGYFTFTLENGFGEPDPFEIPLVYEKPYHMSLHFGDIWMVDQVLKRTGLANILENLLPRGGDTLKALVAFRTIHSVAYSYAEDWYLKSFARELYPEAKLESSVISQFHAILGQEEVYNDFFTKYLTYVTKDENIKDKISIPILIDSTGLPNNIKTYLTAKNNHNGLISNEIRLIYVVDKIKKLPIFFRYVPGNIIDNSTLITTINLLKAYNVNIESILADAGYSSLKNIEQLLLANIPFITRLPRNRNDYKDLISKYATNLRDDGNLVSYGKRNFYGKKVTFKLFGKYVNAFVMLDINQETEDENYYIYKYREDDDQEAKVREKSPSFGKFVILSTKDYDLEEIIPFYYTRQTIEQTFDIGKNFADLLPLRAHSEEVIRARLLISFISTILYTSISHELKDCNFSANKAIFSMGNLDIKIYNNVSILEEITKTQKETFIALNLECPYPQEKGNILKHKSFLENNKLNEPRKRKGRPKGSKNTKRKVSAVQVSVNLDSKDTSKRTRGRPKGSRNKVKATVEPSISLDSTESPRRRTRGRPKGSRNKVKTTVEPSISLDSTESPRRRTRGRPKGSKNKVKDTV